jgi:hypothetical protein
MAALIARACTSSFKFPLLAMLSMISRVMIKQLLITITMMRAQQASKKRAVGYRASNGTIECKLIGVSGRSY